MPEGQGTRLSESQTQEIRAELNSLLATPGGVELLRAFSQIPSGEARSAIMAIVKGLVPAALCARS